MPNKNQFKTHEEYIEWYRNYRAKNKEKFRQYNKEYNKLWRRKYGYHSEYRWKEKNKEKVNVERLLQYAVKKGLVKKSPCIVCQNPKAVAHHPDYAKPLEVTWLCHIHHSEIHKKG